MLTEKDKSEIDKGIELCDKISDKLGELMFEMASIINNFIESVKDYLPKSKTK